ncbi:MAG: DUF948 domain-containing protein [Actinobacteria bacterium]|nr:DUF948 domain-containing protein [Actinomycetota bacterium]
MTVLASTSGDVLDYALALFFAASGLGLAYMLFRLGGTFERLSSFIRGTERELLPVIEKSGGTIDRVNRELDKLDTVTDSAVSMAESADTAVRAVSTAITTPVKKVSGLSAAVSHGLSAFRARRNPGEAMDVAKQAARRREAELDEELRRAGTAADPVAPEPASWPSGDREPDLPPAA